MVAVVAVVAVRTRAHTNNPRDDSPRASCYALVMAWHTDLRTVAAASCALVLTACGDSGGREASGASLATTATNPSSITLTMDGSDSTPTGEPTTTVTGGVSDSASASATTGDDDSSTAGITGATADPTSTTTGSVPCPMGQVECEGTTAKVCDGMGGHTSETPCAKACAPQLGCVECVPGSHQCIGEVSQVCTDDGAGWQGDNTCDAVQGLTCDPGTGACVGACAALGSSYIGCDYYPVVTQQLDAYVGGNPYAVAVANTTNETATITVTRGPNPVVTDTVLPGSVKVIPLPWVNELALGTGPTALVPGSAYRLRSSRPVTVYQYNPLNADVTNDASLLLPVNTWTGNYLVAAWQHWDPYPGFYSVTASQDNTTVTLTAPKGGVPTQAGGGVDGNGNGVVVLNEGDVLQVITGSGGDLTGSLVAADKPVQVVGGHECTQVPIGTTACDHLEESMFPIETLAKEYIVVPPVQVPNDALEKAVIVRIVASEPNTTLTFDPDQPVAKTLANAGDFIEVPPTTAKFVVKADKKILVAEYMVGQDGGYGTSDPCMVLAVPSAQYRTNYLFYAQTGWEANYVDIIAPVNSNVMVDGVAAANFTPIGASGFGLAHVKLSNAGDGSHSVTSDQKVGISVYGVVSYGSYWYPGGLDLDLIPPQ